MSDYKPCAPEHLIDRIQIQDLLTLYFTDLTNFDRSGMAHHFTDDAVLDINGKIMTGHSEIETLYQSSEALLAEGQLKGKYHMLADNIMIQVTGDRASANLLYTGLMCDDMRGPPKLVEMGREYDELVKINGEWQISKRVLRSDAGMIDFYAGYLEETK